MERRHSKKREEIKTILLNQHGALSAATMHTTLPHIDLTTIYRNLERFVEEGTVKKFNLDGTETLYEYQVHPHHHAICTDCGEVIHFTAPDEKIKQLLGLTGFAITDLEVTVRGLCSHKNA